MEQKSDNFVFIRDPEHVWIPAVIQDPEYVWIPTNIQQESSTGETVPVRIPQYESEQAIACDNGLSAIGWEHEEVLLQDYVGGVLPKQTVDGKGTLRVFPDMTRLPFLHEAALLYNLKERHKQGRPYTRMGNIIFAVNPFQWFRGLYADIICNHYARALVWDGSNGDPRRTLEPHIYETSALAYRELARNGKDQSILVCGESGAGKTETVKLCMNHIAVCQQALRECSSAMTPTVQRILESNVVLEAFGNAKTVKNDNSSRYGKYIQLQFDVGDTEGTCRLVGSKVDAFFLEKSRIIDRDPTERAHHIFYQIIAAKDKTKYWSKLAGTTNESFRFIGKTYTDTSVEDSVDFDRNIQALEKIGIAGDKLMTLMQAIIIVMQLGNLTFKLDPSDRYGETSQIASEKEFAELCDLMSIPEAALKKALTERTIKCRGESYKVPVKPDRAREATEIFAKEIYGRAFLWLVRAINDATAAEINYKSGSTTSFGIIGLLDIFGFQSCARNGFEQLCINYCNEKLQAKFNEDIFCSVQEEYKREGISLDEITYDDNTDVLTLIESKAGLLARLNEECVRPRGNDQAYISMAMQANKRSPCLLVDKRNRCGFGIHHYAGKVMYDATGFVASNRDALPTDFVEVALLSSNEILAKHMTNDACQNFASEEVAESKPDRPRRRRWHDPFRHVWTKYKRQLSSLMVALKKTNPLYIRCIKPNNSKRPFRMEHLCTIEQLRCAGAVAVGTLGQSIQKIDRGCIARKGIHESQPAE